MPVKTPFPSMWLHGHVVFRNRILNQSIYLFFFLQQFLSVSVVSNSAFYADVLKR